MERSFCPGPPAMILQGEDAVATVGRSFRLQRVILNYRNAVAGVAEKKGPA